MASESRIFGASAFDNLQKTIDKIPYEIADLKVMLEIFGRLRPKLERRRSFLQSKEECVISLLEGARNIETETKARMIAIRAMRRRNNFESVWPISNDEGFSSETEQPESDAVMKDSPEEQDNHHQLKRNLVLLPKKRPTSDRMFNKPEASPSGSAVQNMSAVTAEEVKQLNDQIRDAEDNLEILLQKLSKNISRKTRIINLMRPPERSWRHKQNSALARLDSDCGKRISDSYYDDNTNDDKHNNKDESGSQCEGMVKLEPPAKRGRLFY